MSKFDFSTIDTKKAASFPQVRAISFRFATSKFKSVSKTGKPDAKLAAQIRGVIYSVHKDEPLTHGEVQKMFNMDTLPKKYRDAYDPDFKKTESKEKAPDLASFSKEQLRSMLSALEETDSEGFEPS